MVLLAAAEALKLPQRFKVPGVVQVVADEEVTRPWAEEACPAFQVWVAPVV